MVRSGVLDPFWDWFESESWEPETLDVLDRHLGPGTTFVDVGAWIGPLTLWAACLGASVHAYEPDPQARDELVANLALNPELESRVTVLPIALGAASGTMTLSGGGYGLGMSYSRLVDKDAGKDDKASGKNDTGDRATVDVVDAAEEAKQPHFTGANLVKIDIEGGEYVVVPRLREYLARGAVPVLLSMHAYDLQPRSRTDPSKLEKARQRLVQVWRSRAVYRSLDGYPVLLVADRGRWKTVRRRGRFRLGLALVGYEIFCGPAGTEPVAD